MMIRFCIVMIDKLSNLQTKELYYKIKAYKANLTDLGDKVYITGRMSYANFCLVLYECLQFGDVDCEAGIKDGEE